MLFSTRAEYGLRFLVSLADRYQKDTDTVSIRTIAEQEHISRPYLEKLAVILKEAGIVSGTKGFGGGYVLAKNPAEISLAEAIEALEGRRVKPYACPAVNEKVVCALSGGCRTQRVWKRIDDSVNSALTGMTLADVIA